MGENGLMNNKYLGKRREVSYRKELNWSKSFEKKWMVICLIFS